MFCEKPEEKRFFVEPTICRVLSWNLMKSGHWTQQGQGKASVGTPGGDPWWCQVPGIQSGTLISLLPTEAAWCARHQENERQTNYPGRFSAVTTDHAQQPATLPGHTLFQVPFSYTRFAVPESLH